MKGFRFALLLLAAAGRLPAQNLADFEKRVTEFTLPNGLRFLVVERHETPVVCVDTFVNAGSVDDLPGETGMAHVLERMAFKGSEAVGTQDAAGERHALEAAEEVAERLETERGKGSRGDSGKIAGLEAELNLALSRAQNFVIPNQLLRVLQENGAVDLQAAALYDSSEFRYNLPSNRIELWFLLESQWLQHPVMREFYAERNALAADYRANVENNPQGKLVQALLPAAFTNNPYRNPDLGWPGDLASLRAARAKAFFEKYYVPGNLLMTIVGDVNPAEARRLADRYFGPIPARPAPAPPRGTEPMQAGPKTVEVYSSTPIVIAAYKRPDMYDKDDPVFDIIKLMLSNERTGVLTKKLVEEKRVAQAVEMLTPFPGGRFSNLAVFYAAPSPGHTPAEVERALNDVVNDLQTHAVDATALARARAQARLGLLRQLSSNSGMAASLAAYEMHFGTWRKLFTSLDDLNKVTANDVMRVARQYFVPSGRTLGISEPRSMAGAGENR